MTNKLENKIFQALKKGTIIPACPLAIHEDKSFDEFHQRLLAHYYTDAGAGGLAVGVHTTQFEIRDLQYNLFESVLKVMSEEIDACDLNRTFVKVAGICGPTEQAVSEARIAVKYGYHIGLLSMGGLDDLSEDELLDRTKEVAKIIPIFGFYLQKTISGRVFSFDFWKKFVEIDNVVAVKTAPFNRYQTLDVMRAVCESSRKDEIVIYTGNDDNIIPDLLTNYRMNVNGMDVVRGFDGGLLGHWAVWTGKIKAVFDNVQRTKTSGKGYDELLELGTQITDCNSAFFDQRNDFKGSIAGINEVLSRQGLLEGNYCLSSNEVLSEGQSEEIDRVYKAYPHLNDDEFVSNRLTNWKSLVEKSMKND